MIAEESRREPRVAPLPRGGRTLYPPTRRKRYGTYDRDRAYMRVRARGSWRDYPVDRESMRIVGGICAFERATERSRGPRHKAIPSRVTRGKSNCARRGGDDSESQPCSRDTSSGETVCAELIRALYYNLQAYTFR